MREDNPHIPVVYNLQEFPNLFENLWHAHFEKIDIKEVLEINDYVII